MSTTFRTFQVKKTAEGFSAGLEDMDRSELPDGEVTVKIAYSGVNYKDGLASIPEGRVVRSYPCTPGIDLAGVVEESSDARFKAGDEVLATGYDLGVTQCGGFSEYMRLSADWIVPLPKGLTLQEAMALGTAGFTAALAVHQLEKNGLRPENGPVLITGATGGVGSIAISILHNLGYGITASTGKESAYEYLRELGAEQIIARALTSAESKRPLETETWAGSVDAVGGSTLAYLLRTTKRHGSIASCGNTGGANLATTVFPFILRGINLLGIDSAFCPMELRRELWKRLASDYKPAKLLSHIGYEVSFEELPTTLERILKGGVRGRTVIRIA